MNVRKQFEQFDFVTARLLVDYNDGSIMTENAVTEGIGCVRSLAVNRPVCLVVSPGTSV